MMLMRSLWIAALLLAALPSSHAQAEWPRPNWDRVEIASCRFADKTVSYPIEKYEVRIQSVPDQQIGDHNCRADLIDHSGKSTPLLQAWELSIHQGTGEDIFGDGHPTLILEAFSGGAHCCYTYRLVSLSDPPVVLRPIENEAPFYFFKDKATGQFRIMTSDGAFDYFDGMCHACVPFPRVVLQADASGLRDVSVQFTEQYDSEIAAARARIAEGDIGKFITADFQDAKAVVLDIVYSYLYSGREVQAWQTLDEMWPTGDRERIKKLILKTRAEGLLSKLAKTKP